MTLNLSQSIFPEITEFKKAGYIGKKSTKLILKGTIISTDSETSRLVIEEGSLNGKKFYRFHDEIDYFFEKTKLDKKYGEIFLANFNDLILLLDTDRYFTKEELKNGNSPFEIKTFKNALYELNINADRNVVFEELVSFLDAFEFSEESTKKLGSNYLSFPFKKGTAIGFAKFGDEIEVMLKNNSGRYPLKSFGTGIQQFLFILAKINISESRIVIIEEIELNLSPLYQKELLRFIKLLMPKKFDQLLFSSHSPFFTQKESNMVNIIHHVQIDHIVGGGTSVDCHADFMDQYDAYLDHSLFSLLYS